MISRNSAPKYGFGTSERRAATSHGVSKLKGVSENLIDNLGGPGPGQYDLKNIIGNEGQKKTLSYRFDVDLTAKEQI